MLVNVTTPAVETEPSLTIAGRVVAFLNKNKGRAYCDDCIKDHLGLARRQQAQRNTEPLSFTPLYKREQAPCDSCGREKLVTRAI
jgi:hypothetical protein